MVEFREQVQEECNGNAAVVHRELDANGVDRSPVLRRFRQHSVQIYL